jgi:hypothetical protein
VVVWRNKGRVRNRLSANQLKVQYGRVRSRQLASLKYGRVRNR